MPLSDRWAGMTNRAYYQSPPGGELSASGYVILVLGNHKNFGTHASIVPARGDVTIICDIVYMSRTISRVHDLPYFKSGRCGVSFRRTYHVDYSNRGDHRSIFQDPQVAASVAS